MKGSGADHGSHPHQLVDTPRARRYLVDKRRHEHVLGCLTLHVSIGPLASEIPAGDWVVVTGQGGVLLCSGGNDFFPTVRVEVWDGTPPVSVEEWDEPAETAFEAPSGTLRLTSVDSAPAGPDIDLGAAGGYQLRAYSRGRGEAMERIGVELYYRGVEEWLIQVWLGARSSAASA